MTTELTVPVAHLPDTAASVDYVAKRLEMIGDLMRRTMQLGVDYGVVPGTNNKPTLLKPGAEKLCVMFHLAERFDTEKTWLAGDHLMVESKCRIHDMQDRFLGEASAVCSTRESKYAWRRAERQCPQCGKAAVFKSKKDGEGWYCWRKKDGCGATFAPSDPAIVGQVVGRVPNPDLPDSYNTVVRIAEKRALIGAVRMVTGASSLFDEERTDAEDDGEVRDEPPQKAEPPKQSTLAGKAPSVAAEYDDPKFWAAFIAAPTTTFAIVQAAMAACNKAVGGVTEQVQAAITAGLKSRGWDKPQTELDKWMDRLKNPATAEFLNQCLEGWQKLPEGNDRKAIGKQIADRAAKDGYAFDRSKGCYAKKEVIEPIVCISGEQCIDLAGLLSKAGVPCEEFLRDYAIGAIGELPAVHWQAAKSMLEGMIANKQRKAQVPA